MGRAQSDTYSSLFTKSDNVNLDETFDRKSALVHVLMHRTVCSSKFQPSGFPIEKVCCVVTFQLNSVH